MAGWVPRDVNSDRSALWCAHRWVRYGELAQRSLEVAAIVRARARASTGARPIVPVLGANSFELVAAYLGVVAAGAIPALVPDVSDEAMAAVLGELGADFALVEPAAVDRIRGLGARRALPFDVRGDAIATAADDAGPGELALVIYTSGSTSRPRGVMLSWSNLRASAAAIAAAAPLDPDERSIVTLPLHYCYGLSVLHTHLARGAAVILPTGPAIAGELLELIDATGATGLPAVPGLVHLLLRDAAARARLDRLRYVMISGGRLGDDDLRALLAAAPRTRIDVRYGLTEATAAASFLPPHRLADKLGSIGVGLPGAPLHVLDDAGRPIGAGSDELGEIVVRGAHVALGYFGESPGFGGEYRTGDRARIDRDGFVYVAGRTRTFVKTGGHRVAVEEIEAVLERADGVASAAVCGVPHATRGEALIALIVARADRTPSAAELRAHCAAALPAFKIPVELRTVTSLPRTASGKLDRTAIAALAAAQIGRS